MIPPARVGVMLPAFRKTDALQEARLYVPDSDGSGGEIGSVGVGSGSGSGLGPNGRVINLETSITRSDDYWKGKGINYRMHPDHIACLTAARIDVCTLSNNHVLDYGYEGLIETLDTLTRAGLRFAGLRRNKRIRAV